MIDMNRDDAIAKSLRDDYAAYNHVATTYTMLHTTALALADSETTVFAEKGLRTYAGMVPDINQIIPGAVIHDLKDNEDHPIVKPNVVKECQKTIDSVGKPTANK